ncbi:MAG: hypothetical protein HYX24_03870 [Candidatus Aenigmarchaeota archaeon]|nr:hypothetical protein [Candidatus Aenigmarchaeota archaeon]
MPVKRTLKNYSKYILIIAGILLFILAPPAYEIGGTVLNLQNIGVLVIILGILIFLADR